MSTTVQVPTPPHRAQLASNAGNVFARPGLPDHVSAGAVAIESERAIAEAQGKLVIAKRFPRDEAMAYTRMMEACRHYELASEAFYTYERGGQKVHGPSIRLAEELARCWGNIEYGLRELSRRQGESEMEAFGWDYETNTITTQRFTVKHVRDTRQGRKDLSDERDIYEIGANNGARRMRARVLALLPAYFKDAAIRQCTKTLESDTTQTLPDRQRGMALAFTQVGVTVEMLKQRLGHSLDQTTAEELTEYRGILTSIKEGNTQVSDWFSPAGNAVAGPPPSPVQGVDSTGGQKQGVSDGGSSQASEEKPKRGAQVSGEPSEATPSIELYVADELGELIGSEDAPTVFTDPVAFAEFVANRWASSNNREAVVENNADAIEDARKASPDAAAVLAQMMAHVAAAANWAVEVPKLRGGKPDTQKYLAALRDMLSAAMNAQDVAAFIAENQGVWSTASAATNAAIKKLVHDRCVALGIADPLPPAEPAEGRAAAADVGQAQSASQTEASASVGLTVSQKTKSGLLKDLEGCTDRAGFDAFLEQGMVDRRLAKLDETDRNEVDGVIKSMRRRFHQGAEEPSTDGK